MTFKIGQRHRFRENFTKAGITAIDLAQMLQERKIEKSVSTVTQYLNGYRAVPEDVEKVFQEIADELKGGDDYDTANHINTGT